MNRIPEKQPAATFQTANVAVPPRRLSHIFPMSNPSSQPDAWPRGHQAASWNTPTEKMMIGSAEVCCTYQKVHSPGPPIWQGQSGRGQSHSGWARLSWTHVADYITPNSVDACGPTITRMCTRRCWERGVDLTGRAQREHMLTVLTPLQHVWAALFIPQRPSSKTTGLSSKLSEGSTKMLLQIPSMKKITHGTDWWFFQNPNHKC